MRKEYTINELTEIFGCSRTAIVKKIKTDENNPVIKRYKGVYDVVTSNGNIAILFDDEDLEHEKRLSKGFKNVSNSTVNTPENDTIIDVVPEKEPQINNNVLDFTNRYITEFTTFQKEMYNELKQRDNQILLLTTSEKNKEDEYLRTQAENKTLKRRNTILTVTLSVIVTVLLISATVFITYITVQNNVTKQEQEKITQQEIIQENVKPIYQKPTKK